jgi:hypothetical protein
LPLCALSAQLKTLSGDRITLDFSQMRWVDANLVSAIGGIVEEARARDNTVRLAELRPRTRSILDRNGFLSGREFDPHGTTIPYRRFALTEAKEFSAYVGSHLRGHGLPDMSEAVRLRLLQGLGELFINSALHSRCQVGAFACGQVYPREAHLDFTLVDMGVGFCANVSRYLRKPVPADEAIDWAISGENTTREGDIPGGLGLKIVKGFVALNAGSLTILSDRGYWRLDKEGVSREVLPVPFVGTMVNLRINTADKSSYKLSTEVDANAAL